MLSSFDQAAHMIDPLNRIGIDGALVDLMLGSSDGNPEIDQINLC